MGDRDCARGPARRKRLIVRHLRDRLPPYRQGISPPTISMSRKTSVKSTAPSSLRSQVHRQGETPPTVSMSENTSPKSTAPSSLRSQVKGVTVRVAALLKTRPQLSPTMQSYVPASAAFRFEIIRTGPETPDTSEPHGVKPAARSTPA